MFRVNYFSSTKNIHQVHQHQEGNFLYLGDYTAALDVKMLKAKNIKTVITAAAGLPVDFTGQDIYHVVYNALDMPNYNIAKHFSDSYDKIEEGFKQGSVFVHCAAGISRSSSIVIHYLMKKYLWTYTKTFHYVRSKRKIICPNPGFQRQLLNFEKNLKKQSALSNTVESIKLAQTQNFPSKIDQKLPLRGTSTNIMKNNIKEQGKSEIKKSSVPPNKRLNQANLNLKIVTIKK